MKIIMLSGYKGSGKDTSADFLASHGYAKISFADSLKNMVAREYGLNRYIFDDQEWKEIALPDYPVVSDGILSRQIQKEILSEFRTLSGKTAHTVYYEDNKLKLKNVMSDGLVTIKEQLYWTPRALLILHGSIGRTVNLNHWVEKAMNTQSPRVVIADWRMKAEYDSVVKLVGKENVLTVRVNRYESKSDQQTERQLDNFEFDVVIDNTGSIEDLHKQLRRFL